MDGTVDQDQDRGQDPVLASLRDRPGLARAVDLVRTQAHRGFGEAVHAYVRCCRAVEDAAGLEAAAAFAANAPACAAAVGTDAAIRLASSLARVAAAAGLAGTVALARAAPKAAKLLRQPSAFNAWLDAVERVAVLAGASLAAVVGRTEAWVAEAGLDAFTTWVAEGERSTAPGSAARSAWFAAGPRAARPTAEDADSDVRFADIERSLSAFACALWGVPLVLRSLPCGDADRPARSGFEGSIVRIPDLYRGYDPRQARSLYAAAVAHVAAHLRHGDPKWRVGSLKPLQVALVSLIEDARIERLAGNELPGLLRLWRGFHVAQPSGASTAPALMARLARALIDDDYTDADAWVGKGRRLFHDERGNWHDPAISRHIGGLLGNDLGQMRVQFNARTYVVQPVYRDDNAGLWDFGDGASFEDADALPVPVRTERHEADTGPAQLPASQDRAGSLRARPADADVGVPVARYPEWDFLIGRERRDWTTVVEYEPALGNSAALETLLRRDRRVLDRIAATIRAARISRPTRLRAQPEGDQLDLDAALAATIDRRAGLAPTPRVYARQERRSRDLSILLLLDGSRSTQDRVPGTDQSVLQLEIEAASMLAHAMNRLGDPFAIRAFCSDGRHDVRYQPIKEFDLAWDGVAMRRLAGLTPEYSTRMGAALRHAGTELLPRRTYRRLLLLISDGEPSDIDVPDRRYLVEDARRAVHQLSHAGVDVFCVGLPGTGESSLVRVFGPHNAHRIERLQRLPDLLTSLYFRMTA